MSNCLWKKYKTEPNAPLLKKDFHQSRNPFCVLFLIQCVLRFFSFSKVSESSNIQSWSAKKVNYFRLIGQKVRLKSPLRCLPPSLDMICIAWLGSLKETKLDYEPHIFCSTPQDHPTYTSRVVVRKISLSLISTATVPI